ncbi:MAG: HXXEE domain-containing protein [Pyrinomonadaceae bacterium]|nr:HXXEE domain-containing protein [Pyrinomonadaceae bacterium]
MSRKTLLWLVPVLLTLHNLEEAFLMPAFIEKRNASVQGAMRGVVPPVTYKQFLIALVIITVIPYLIALLWLGRRWAVYLLVGFQVVMLINVFAHTLMALFLHGYAPGLVTAILINLPFSLYLLKRAVGERWMSKRAVAWMFPIGLLIHGPALAGLMLLSGAIADMA